MPRAPYFLVIAPSPPSPPPPSPPFVHGIRHLVPVLGLLLPDWKANLLAHAPRQRTEQCKLIQILILHYFNHPCCKPSYKTFWFFWIFSVLCLGACAGKLAFQSVRRRLSKMFWASHRYKISVWHGIWWGGGEVSREWMGGRFLQCLSTRMDGTGTEPAKRRRNWAPAPGPYWLC